MLTRQREVPVTQLVKTMTKGAGSSAELFRTMVMEAYEVPAYSSDEYKRRAADEYRNKWELDCLKVKTKKR